MKPLSVTDQITLWLACIIIPAMVIPTVADAPTTVMSKFPHCALALFLVSAAGLACSLRAYSEKLTEEQILRRVIALQTIPAWGIFATWVLIWLLNGVALALPEPIFRMIK